MSVNPYDTLHLIVEASLALAGFSGVVVVLGRRSAGEWSGHDRSNLLNLLSASFGALFMSLSALVLLHAEVAPEATWKIVGAAWLVVSSQQALLNIRRLHEMPVGERPSGAILFVVNSTLAVVAVLQVWNLIGAARFWPLALALMWLFGLASLAFCRLLLVRTAANA